jgi:hypothetical protein
MKVKWLVEADVFDDNQEQLLKALKDNNYEYHVLKYVPFDDNLANDCLKIYGPNECVVFYGSLNFGHKLKKNPWIPGVYLNEPVFKCTSYYPILSELLLHSTTYFMLPFGDLLRRKDWIYNIFRRNQDLTTEKIFIRPDSGLKEFTGMICPYEDFEECVKLASFYDVDSDMLVLISSVVPLKKEWRFVIVNGNVVSGSLYRDWSSSEKKGNTFTIKDYVLRHSYSKHEICNDEKALYIAKKGAKLYTPDICWTMDVVETENNEYKILEIGCFSCAGLYGNDMNIVVDKVSEAAMNEWKEYNE